MMNTPFILKILVLYIKDLSLAGQGIVVSKLCGGPFTTSHKVKIQLVEIKNDDYRDFQLQWKSGPAKGWRMSKSQFNFIYVFMFTRLFLIFF